MTERGRWAMDRVAKGGGYAGAAILAVLLAAGCATFGGTGSLPPGASTIAIPMFRNETLEPGIEEAATQVLAERFMIDGRLKIAPRDVADLVLSGTITSYDLRSQAYDREDRVFSSSVRIGIAMSLLDAESGDYVFFNRPYTETGTYYEAIQPLGRRQNDVLIRLANRVIDTVMEDW